MKILYTLNRIWLFLSHPFRSGYLANVCGHRTKLSGTVCHVTGDSSTLTMPLAENGRPDYCLDCIGKMAVPCVWCGKSIHIGEPIVVGRPFAGFTLKAGGAVYRGTPDFSLPAERLATDETVAPEDSLLTVGCLRWNCAESGALRNGFWYPPGLVRRAPSPLEMAMSAPPGSAVIVGNLGDPSRIGEVV